jgi:type II secretory pathway pseudopilin PulG
VNTRHEDGGFTLLETVVSLGILAAVMSAMTIFFVRSSTVTRQQSDYQAATQAATVAMERVNLLHGVGLVAGRGEQQVRTQWQSAPPEVGKFIRDTQPAWQDPPVWHLAVWLSTDPQPVTVTGAPRKFSASWYVGYCWRAASSDVCDGVEAAASLPMYRVVVAVTWSSKDCSGGRCVYAMAALFPRDVEDPTFA